MDSWTEYKIGDLCEVGRGSSPRPILDQRYFIGGQIPWIKIADATASGKYIFETKEHVNEFGASFSRYLEKDSLIIAASGVSLGQIKFLGVKGCIHDGWLYTSNFKTDLLVKEFLYYFLIYYAETFHNFSSGAAIQNINTDILKKTALRLPPVGIQSKISAILSSYDDLIEINTQRRKLFEETAKEIYKEWFVRMRFPDYKKAKFLKGFPVEWGIKKFGQVIELLYGKALKDEDRAGGDFPVYGSSGVVGFHNTSIAKAPGIVIGRKGNVGSVFWVTKDFYPIDTSYYVKSQISLFYLYFNLQDQNFIEGDSAVPGLSRNQAYSNLIIIPEDNLLKKFDEIIGPIFSQIENLQNQNDQLRQIRDRLLPRLISGKLKIKK